MMNPCPCPFHAALARRIFPSGQACPEQPDLASLRDNAHFYCCIALILFLTCRCDDIPAFIAKMRDVVRTVYVPPADH